MIFQAEPNLPKIIENIDVKMATDEKLPAPETPAHVNFIKLLPNLLYLFHKFKFRLNRHNKSSTSTNSSTLPSRNKPTHFHFLHNTAALRAMKTRTIKSPTASTESPPTIRAAAAAIPRKKKTSK